MPRKACGALRPVRQQPLRRTRRSRPGAASRAARTAAFSRPSSQGVQSVFDPGPHGRSSVAIPSACHAFRRGGRSLATFDRALTARSCRRRPRRKVRIARSDSSAATTGLVGRGGFEPPISWSQTRRFSGLSHRPPAIEHTRSGGNPARVRGTRGRVGKIVKAHRADPRCLLDLAAAVTRPASYTVPIGGCQARTDVAIGPCRRLPPACRRSSWATFWTSRAARVLGATGGGGGRGRP